MTKKKKSGTKELIFEENIISQFPPILNSKEKNHFWEK
jgi:hypothetical protein